MLALMLVVAQCSAVLLVIVFKALDSQVPEN